MTDVLRRDQVSENKFCKHNFTHSILSFDRPLKPSSGNTSNAFSWRYLNRKVKNSQMKKFIRGSKENYLLVHCNKNSNSNNPNHYLQEKYGLHNRKKKGKTTKRNISRGSEPAFMLRIREEKAGRLFSVPGRLVRAGNWSWFRLKLSCSNAFIEIVKILNAIWQM